MFPINLRSKEKKREEKKWGGRIHSRGAYEGREETKSHLRVTADFPHLMPQGEAARSASALQRRICTVSGL